PLPDLEPDPRLDPAAARAARLRPLPPGAIVARARAGARALASLPAERAVHRHRLRPPLGRLARPALAGRGRGIRLRVDGDAAGLRLAVPRARGRAAPTRRRAELGRRALRARARLRR